MGLNLGYLLKSFLLYFFRFRSWRGLAFFFFLRFLGRKSRWASFRRPKFFLNIRRSVNDTIRNDTFISFLLFRFGSRVEFFLFILLWYLNRNVIVVRALVFNYLLNFSFEFNFSFF